MAEVIAIQKYVRMSPKKLRVVADIARKLTPERALETLPFLGKKGSQFLVKVIKSAIANAKQKGLLESDLIFKEIQVNEGPRLKRWKAGARGVAKPRVRPMSHIRVVLTTISSKSEALNSKQIKKGERSGTES